VQRAQLESHIECATKIHLDLACGELWDTREKLKEKITRFNKLEERVNILYEQLEEKVNDIQHQHQYNVDSLQQHHRRHDTLQAKLKQEVNTCQTKLGQKISMERNILLVLLLLSLVLLPFCLTSVIQSLEDKFQTKLEEKISIIKSLHGKNVGMVKKDIEDKFQTKLEEKISVIQNLHEKNVGMVKKDIEDKFQTKLEEKISVIQNLHEKNVILEEHSEVSHIYMWKVTSFEEKLTQAKSKEKLWVNSIPFYAFGYKLMMQLRPNADGVGLNSHLSVFIVVTKGEFDAILPWGFSKRVTFTLIDQQDNSNLRQNVVVGFTADPNNVAFKKPVDGETRRGYGFPKFISHNDLRKRRFLVDDTLFIKVQVDSPEANTSWF